MLRQGIYTLRVKAFNTYDSSVSETSITFEVLAPWYSGTIAIIIYNIILIILLYLFIRHIKLRSQKAAQAIKIEKDRELDEQKRIHLAEAQEKEREIVTLKNQQLEHDYPQLNINDKRLCAYLKMGLSSKEIAPLLNMSVRSVEMTRYRLRKKMGLERETNLATFLQKI